MTRHRAWLFVTIPSLLIISSCASDEQSMNIMFDCPVGVDEMEISLHSVATQKEYEADLNEAGMISTEKLPEGRYILEMWGYTQPVTYPTLWVRRDMDLPIAGGVQLPLPEPGAFEVFSFRSQGAEVIMELVNRSLCIRNANVRVYAGRNAQMVPDDSLLIFSASGVVLDNGGTVEMPFDPQRPYVIWRVSEEHERYSWEATSVPTSINTEITGLKMLVTGERTEFHLSANGQNFSLLSQQHAYYVICPEDNHNNPSLDGRDLVVNGGTPEERFVECRTQGGNGVSKFFRSSTDGVVNLQAALAFQGVEGTCAITAKKYLPEDADAWTAALGDTLEMTDKPTNSVTMLSRTLAPGTYRLHVHSERASSSVMTIYGLYNETTGTSIMRYNTTDNRVFNFYDSVPRKQEPAREIEFTLGDESTVLLMVVNGQQGLPSTVKFTLFQP